MICKENYVFKSKLFLLLFVVVALFKTIFFNKRRGNYKLLMIAKQFTYSYIVKRLNFLVNSLYLNLVYLRDLTFQWILDIVLQNLLRYGNH